MASLSLTQLQTLIENVLCESQRFYERSGVRVTASFDRNRNQFLLIEEGWEGYKRIHFPLAHLEIQENLIYIQRDGTHDGLALDLLRAGVPAEKLVLAFKHPSERYPIEPDALLR